MFLPLSLLLNNHKVTPKPPPQPLTNQTLSPHSRRYRPNRTSPQLHQWSHARNHHKGHRPDPPQAAYRVQQLRSTRVHAISVGVRGQDPLGHRLGRLQM